MGEKIFSLALKKVSLWLDFHAAIRYSPLVRYIRNSAIKNPSILELGSGPIGIVNYLKGKIIGLDNNPRQVDFGTLRLVKGLASYLPFEDGEFDFTISVDFLEHIPPAKRKEVIAEMFRVTQGDILISVPCGKKVIGWEKKLKDVLDKKSNLWHKKDGQRESFVKQRGTFLSEHAEMGLPDESEVIALIKGNLAKAKYRYHIETMDNESLWVWYVYALAELKYNYFRWFITTLLALLFLPLLKHIKWGGCYRKIFIIKNE